MMDRYYFGKKLQWWAREHSYLSANITGGERVLDIPLPEQYGDWAVHPCVRRIEGGLGGHEWWLALSPYPDFDSTRESILLYRGDANGDVPPTGWVFVREICGRHAQGFNSDPNLYWDGSELWVVWRECETENVPSDSPYCCIMCTRTADGVNFSAPQMIAKNHFAEKDANGDTSMSPCIADFEGRRYMYGSHYKFEPVLRPLGIARYGQDGEGFGGCETASRRVPFDLWHLDLFSHNGLLYQVATPQSGNAIYLGWSSDGLNFNYFSRPLYHHRWFFRRNYFYKPSVVISGDNLYLFFPRRVDKGSVKIVVRSVSIAKFDSIFKPRLLCSVPLPPPVHGSSLMCETLVNAPELRRRFDVDVLKMSTATSIDDIAKFRLRKVAGLALTYMKLAGRLLTRRYDICYLAVTCYGLGFLKDAPFVLLCKFFCRNVVLHQHNKGMDGCRSRFPYRFMLPWVYRHTSVILLSERLYPDIEAVVSHDRVRICPNGIADLAPSGVKAGNGRPRLLFLSNLIPAKGVIDMLDALSILKREGRDCECIFAGNPSADIDEARMASEIASRGLEDSVRYIGPVYGDAKDRLVEGCDLFVLPSHGECLPLVILEAMRASRAVVATDVGAIADLVEEGRSGLLCPPKDPQALAEAMGRLVADPELRDAMGRRGRENFAANFTVDAFTGRVIQILSNTEYA